jgi:iron complex transport system permease protein
MPLKKRHNKPDTTALEVEAPSSEGIRLSEDNDNLFASAVNKGHRVDPRAQKIFVLAVVLVVVYVFSIIVPKDGIFSEQNFVNRGEYNLAWFIRSLQFNVSELIAVIAGLFTGQAMHDYYAAGLCRGVIIIFAGAGLALCGAVYQGAFRNALVAPSTLGVMSGSQLGLTVWVALFTYGTAPWESLLWTESSAQEGFLTIGPHPTWGPYNEAFDGAQALYGTINSFGLALTSFIGCIVVVSLVLLTMRLAKSTKVSGIMLIITGQIIGAICGAVNTSIMYFMMFNHPDSISEAKVTLMREIQISSFYRTFTWVEVLVIGVLLAVVFFVIMRLRQKMMLLSFEESEARTMGIDAKRMRFWVVGLCTLLTAVIVSFCGAVGFVGFLVPHLARRLVGPNFKYLIPATTVLGGIFVLGAWTLLCMTLGGGYAEQVGIFISIFGAVIFMVTALRGGGFARGSFK